MLWSSLSLEYIELSLPLGPLPGGVSIPDFGTLLYPFVDCSLLAWFLHYTGSPLVLLDYGGSWFFPVWISFSFLCFLCRGGSGVLSHGAGFLFILRNTAVKLDIGTLCCTWLGDGAT